MKNLDLIFFLIAMIGNNIIFSQDITLPLWEKGIPNYIDKNVKDSIDMNEIMMIRKVDKPSISVFLPSLKNRSKEAVIICPGGGYNILAYDWEGTDIAKWLNSNGITAIVLKYRLPHTKNNIEGRLSPFLDLQRAVRLVRFHADEWGIDTNKIGVMGFSAGGHLASTLGTHFNENFFTSDSIDKLNCKPNFLVLMYPVITFQEPLLHSGSRHFLIGDNIDTTLINYYTNHLHVTKKTPPTFLVHCADDKSVPVENSLIFYQKLRDNDVKAEMHIYPEGGHGFSLAIGNEYLGSWKDRCIDWIKKITK